MNKIEILEKKVRQAAEQISALKEERQRLQSELLFLNEEHKHTKQLARDIVNSRLRKIVALSAAPAQSGQILDKLTTEEKILYDQLVKLISEWKAKILQNGADKQWVWKL